MACWSEEILAERGCGRQGEAGGGGGEAWEGPAERESSPHGAIKIPSMCPREKPALPTCCPGRAQNHCKTVSIKQESSYPPSPPPYPTEPPWSQTLHLPRERWVREKKNKGSSPSSSARGQRAADHS